MNRRPSTPCLRLLAALALGAFATGVLPARAQSPGPTITLGMFVPLTGPLAAIGIPARDGVKVWVGETNAAGGIHGRKLELIA